MIRALSSLCLLAVLIAGGSTASAQQKKKDKIAILGLEVQSQGSSGIDAESTRIAQELTVQLRLQPKAGKGPFQWQPGSEKELIDEKLMNGCDNEEKPCMAKIGEKLGADQLMYGKIERKSQAGSVGYQLSLKLLKVSNQAYTSWTDFIPASETQGSKLTDWAKRGYKKLTNDNEGGTLLVLAKNIDRGTILIDGDERGNINSGRGEVLNLPEGRYKVSVVSSGYYRWNSEEQIPIKNGETTTQEVTLKEMKDKPPKFCDPMVSTCENTGSDDKPKTGFWKGLMVGGLVIATGGGVFGVYSNSKRGDYEAGGDCAIVPSCGNMTDAQRDEEGRKWATRGNISLGIIGGGVVIAGIGLIKGYLVTGGEKQAAGSTTVGARARRRPSGFALTPVVGPEGAGATIRLDW